MKVSYKFPQAMEESITQVRKRDGRLVPFDKKKIADAIFKAAQAVGGQDRYLAEDLAEAVTDYLTRYFPGKTPSVEDIQDCVERVLIKTGHAKTAKAYILYRQQRARVRQIKEGRIPEGFMEEKEAWEKARLMRDIRWSVRRSDEQFSLWDNQRIVEALVRETGLSPAIAEVIVLEVERDLVSAKVQSLTSSLIRELVNAKLISYGLEEIRQKHARLGVPVSDVRELMRQPNADPDEICWRLGAHIKKEYALSEVFSSEVTDSHLAGEIHLHHLGAVDQFFTVVKSLSPEEEIFEASRKLARAVSGEIYWDVRWPGESGGEQEYPWPEYVTAGQSHCFPGRQEIRFGLYLSPVESFPERSGELLGGLKR
ncbi:MAG: ATP cone domain-containing protein, partial [Candidatus Omnitrophica bacterium]|nr:ATP cone domain-containing protein [Candidatus Omnitrophota bacterium]